MDHEMEDSIAQTEAAKPREPLNVELIANGTDRHHWHKWLVTFLSLSLAGSGMLYLAVVMIDPFSTGRFSLTQRIDFATDNKRLYVAGLVRDLRFNAALFGDSTSFALDPRTIAGASGWQLAQLSVPAAIPGNVLTIASAFARQHRGVRTLELFVLSQVWCREIGPNERPIGAFPDWLYNDSSNRVYLSRIFFSEAAIAAAVRVGIWLGLADQMARADGYLTRVPKRDLALLMQPRPTGGPSPDAPIPAIDALADHVAVLPRDAAVVFVWAPPYINALPADGSVAALRLQACKKRAQQIAADHGNSSFLDLMTENSITRNIANYQDPLHYNPPAADQIALAIAGVVPHM